MNQMTLAELVAELKYLGRTQCMDVLVSRHEEPSTRTVILFLPELATAEEVAQKIAEAPGNLGVEIGDLIWCTNDPDGLVEPLLGVSVHNNYVAFMTPDGSFEQTVAGEKPVYEIVERTLITRAMLEDVQQERDEAIEERDALKKKLAELQNKGVKSESVDPLPAVPEHHIGAGNRQEEGVWLLENLLVIDVSRFHNDHFHQGNELKKANELTISQKSNIARHLLEPIGLETAFTDHKVDSVLFRYVEDGPLVPGFAVGTCGLSHWMRMTQTSRFEERLRELGRGRVSFEALEKNLIEFNGVLYEIPMDQRNHLTLLKLHMRSPKWHKDAAGKEVAEHLVERGKHTAYLESLAEMVFWRAFPSFTQKPIKSINNN